LRLLLPVFLFLSAALTANAQDAFQTPADFAVIYDAGTNKTLYCKNCDQPMAPASMSKIMTIEMVLERLKSGDLDEDEMFSVSEHAWRTGGAASGSSTMFLEVGSQAKVIDLLRGVIVQSGNDASIVLAEGLEGSEEAFADIATQRARDVLGLETASFRNATGWPNPDHVISARDLARLTDHLIAEYPDYYPIWAEREFTYNGIRQFNRNPLLGVFEGADGLKTGHTEEAGYGLVGSAERDGERRIIVFNGLDSQRQRAQEAERMMRAAFVDFRIYEFYDSGAEVGEAPVLLGKSETVRLATPTPVTIGLHRRARPDMKVYIAYDGAIKAPIAPGEEVARLIVEAPDAETVVQPLIAMEAVDRKGLFGRAMAGLVHLIRASDDE